MNRITQLAWNMLRLIFPWLLIAGLIFGLGFGATKIGTHKIMSLFQSGLGIICLILIIGLIIWLLRSLFFGHSELRRDFLFWLGRSYGYYVRNNNGRAAIVWYAFLLSSALLIVWSGVTVYYHVNHPIIGQSAGNFQPQGQLTDEEEVIYGQDDAIFNAKIEQEVTVEPWWALSFTSWILWFLFSILHGFVAVAYVIISRRDEMKLVFDRIHDRLDRESGGVLKVEQKQMVVRFLEKVFGIQPVPSIVPAVASAIGPDAATAPPAPVPVAVAIQEKKAGFMAKYGHWLAIIPLVLDEFLEIFRKMRKS